MINILLSGALGKMGKMITSCAEESEEFNIIAGIDKIEEKTGAFPIYSSTDNLNVKADVIIDFSHPSALEGILNYAKRTNTPAVIATTGLSNSDIEKIKEASKIIPIFFSANMSVGINLLISLVTKAASVLENNYDIEIIEKHHNQKIDAPSGTALMIADAISNALSYNPHYVYDRHSKRAKREKKEIGLHSVRAGTITGEHEVIFAGSDEIIEIKHTATSRNVFANGALSAAKFLLNKPNGLYNMSDLVNEEN